MKSIYTIAKSLYTRLRLWNETSGCKNVNDTDVLKDYENFISSKKTKEINECQEAIKDLNDRLIHSSKSYLDKLQEISIERDIAKSNLNKAVSLLKRARNSAGRIDLELYTEIGEACHEFDKH